MAHRDIVPGSGYLGPVLEAADHCRAVIVIFSSSTTTTNVYILERTAARSVPVIWFVLDQTEPPVEFKMFKQSYLTIDACAHPMESNLRSLVVMVKSLLHPNHAGGEMLDGFVERNSEHGTEHTPEDKSVLSEGQDVAPTAKLQSAGIDEKAIETAMRAAEQVIAEMRNTTRDHLDRVSLRGSSTSQERPEPTHPGTRPTGLGQKHRKVRFGLALVGLAAAFVIGMLFHAQITGLLDRLVDFSRHLGLS
jgi:hypothetical protein